MTRRVALLLTLVSLVLALAAPAFAQAPKRGGVLRIADREVPNLDPHQIGRASCRERVYVLV